MLVVFVWILSLKSVICIQHIEPLIERHSVYTTHQLTKIEKFIYSIGSTFHLDPLCNLKLLSNDLYIILISALPYCFHEKSVQVMRHTKLSNIEICRFSPPNDLTCICIF